MKIFRFYSCYKLSKNHIESPLWGNFLLLLRSKFLNLSKISFAPSVNFYKSFMHPSKYYHSTTFFRFLFVLPAAIAISSCTNSYKRASISLKLSGIGEQWVYVGGWNGLGSDITDSFKVSTRGRGNFSLQTTTPEMLALSFDRVHFPILLCVEPGSNVEVTGTASSYQVKGSFESARINTFQQRYNSFLSEVAHLSGLIPDSTATPESDSLASVLIHKRDSLISSFRTYTLSEVRANPYCLSSVPFILTTFDGGQELLPYELFGNTYQKVDSCLGLAYPDKPLVQTFHQHIQMQEKKLAQLHKADRYSTGDVLPAISFETVDSQAISIPGLWAKTILIEFWADWCPQSVSTADQLRILYEKHSNQGFKIIRVGMGLEPEALYQRVKRDSIPWINVAIPDSEKDYWVDSIGVVYLPFNFLIDRSGRVVAKNLFGDTLVRKLDDLLGANSGRLKPDVHPKTGITSKPEVKVNTITSNPETK